MQAWTKEQIFIDGEKYFSSMIDGIHQAKESILFETYIYEKGRTGDLLFKALSAAAQRGVNVLMLIDGVGSYTFSETYEDEFKKADVKVRFYRTLPWDLKRHSKESSNIFTRLRSRLYRINHGTHRKYCLIDQKRLWAGSFNVSDIQCYPSSAQEPCWRDMGICVEGPEVIWAERAFLQSFDWQKDLKKKLKLGSELVLLNQTRTQKRIYRSAQLEKLKSAKTRVWIETPYFVPLNRVFRHLIKLARAGVDVRIVVPKRNDVWVTQWISFSYLFELVKRGVKVYEYKPRFLHNKVFVIDDWMCLGSTNLNHRSFLHDLEMDIVITQPSNKEFTTDTILRDIQESVTLNQDIWRAFPWWKRLASRLLSVFSYWS